MKWTVFLFSLFLFSSCLTVRRIERNCDKFAKVCLTEKDTIIITKEVETIYRDTIVEYRIKKDTIYQEVPVYIRQGLMNSDLSYLETGLARSTAQVISGDLRHFLASGDTVLQIRLDSALKEVSILSTRLELHRDIVTVKENSPFAKLAIKWLWISLFVIVILVFKNKLFGILKLLK